jgi:hypothetical protein
MPARSEVTVDLLASRRTAVPTRATCICLLVAEWVGLNSRLGDSVPACLMPNIRKDRSVSDAMATQTLREKASRLVFQPMQQALEETLGSCAVPPVSRQDAPHDAVPRRLATYGERLRSRAAAMPPREPGLAKLAFVGRSYACARLLPPSRQFLRST